MKDSHYAEQTIFMGIGKRQNESMDEMKCKMLDFTMLHKSWKSSVTLSFEHTETMCTKSSAVSNDIVLVLRVDAHHRHHHHHVFAYLCSSLCYKTFISLWWWCACLSNIVFVMWTLPYYESEWNNRKAIYTAWNSINAKRVAPTLVFISYLFSGTHWVWIKWVTAD